MKISIINNYIKRDNTLYMNSEIVKNYEVTSL